MTHEQEHLPAGKYKKRHDLPTFRLMWEGPCGASPGKMVWKAAVLHAFVGWTPCRKVELSVGSGWSARWRPIMGWAEGCPIGCCPRR